SITQIGKPPPLAVRLEQALPFRRCVGGEDVLGGSPASQTTQKPQAQYHGEARSSGVVPCRVPSLNEECALMHPLQGASFLSTPLQGGILKPPALRVVGDFLFAPCQPTPALAAARAHQRRRLPQARAALHPRHGGGADRPCLDVARSVVVSCATLAPAGGGMSKPRWWETARAGGLVGHVCPHGLL